MNSLQPAQERRPESSLPITPENCKHPNDQREEIYRCDRLRVVVHVCRACEFPITRRIAADPAPLDCYRVVTD